MKREPLKIILLLGLGVAVMVGLYYLFWSLMFSARFDSLAASAEARTSQPVYLIDADTANEVDDLFAIVGALSRDNTYDYDKPRLVGITGAQFHTSPLAGAYTAQESHRINQALVEMMYGRGLTRVGSDSPLLSKDKPQVSAATHFIVEEARKANPANKLQVFILGSCTNLASAILVDPEIVPNVHARYLGFWYEAETGVYDKDEFNTGNDTIALNLLLNTPDLEFTVMTATTSEKMQMKRSELDSLLFEKSAVTQYLKDRWDNYDRWWTDEDPEKKQWTMWDVALIEAYLHPEFATLESRPAPADNLARKINVYTDIEADKMLANYFAVVASVLESTYEIVNQ